MSNIPESSPSLANGSSSSSSKQSDESASHPHPSSLSLSTSELQSPSTSMILTSSSSDSHKMKSLYSQSAKSFLQRDHLKAISCNQSALNLFIQSSSNPTSTDHDQLNKLLILRLTILSTIYSNGNLKSDLIASLTKSSPSNPIHRELLTLLNLDPSEFIQSFWKECLTLSNHLDVDSISVAGLRPNPTTLNLALSLNHSVLSSAILAAIKLDDSSRENHHHHPKLDSNEMVGGSSSSRLISEWFLAAFASINLSEIRDQNSSPSGNGDGLDYENLKLSYEKVIEVYSLHILGVRSREWEYATEIVAYSQLDQAQNQALLSKLATAKSELESRPERERKASLSAMRSYQEEKTKRNELLEKELQESLKKKESLTEANQKKAKGDGLLNGVGQFLKSGKKSPDSSTSTSSTRSHTNTNGSSMMNGKSRRSSTSSENSSTSSVSNTNVSPEKKGKRNDPSGSGSGSGSDGSSPTRKSRDGKSKSLVNGEQAKSKGKEKEGANPSTASAKVSADQDSNSFSNERERLNDFIKKGNEKNSKATLSKETTNLSKSINPSEASSTSSLVKSSNPPPSASSSLSKKSSPSTNSSSNPHQTLIQHILSLRFLGLNLSTYWGYRISTMFGVLITLLFVWKRSTTSNVGGHGAVRGGNESNVGRKVRRNLNGNQNVEGGLVGNAVRRIWDTLRMGTQVSYL